MQLKEQSSRLPKNVEIRPYTRPIKVAFIVPCEESEESQWVLDAVFCESYTRWGGAKSLLLPHHLDTPLEEAYLQWLSWFDPDVIYSYVDLDCETIKQIDVELMPIALLRHELVGEARSWRSYLPDWPTWLSPVKSLSTISSEYTTRGSLNEKSIYLSQHHTQDDCRFLRDNFGVSYDTHAYTYGIQGLFETLCYCAEDVPDNNFVGDIRCSNLSEIVAKIANREVRTFAPLSFLHSEGISHPRNLAWSSSFHIFYGDSVLDRIHFWNCRHLFDSIERGDYRTLIVSPSQAEDREFVTQLGIFLNKHNFISHGNSSPSVSIRSHSTDNGTCEEFAGHLAQNTWNSIRVASDLTADAKPDFARVSAFYRSQPKAGNPFKLGETASTFTPEAPDHFKFLPNSNVIGRAGIWVVELEIERHQDDTLFSNVFNQWHLPRRSEIISAFTKCNAKVSAQGRLQIIPAIEQQGFSDSSTSKAHIDLRLQDDETVFRHLLVAPKTFPRNDLRYVEKLTGRLADVHISDEGQLHRGLVAMFNDNIYEAAVLTNRFWREVIKDYSKDPAKAYSLDHLQTKIHNYTDEELASLIDSMRFASPAQAKNYLKKRLQDGIEALITSGVLSQIHEWRCSYCGNKNRRSLDNLKSLNKCDICAYEHLFPIDSEWKYAITPFVYDALTTAGASTVLWGISWLLNRSRTKQQVYLPELDLFHSLDNPEDKNEIDIVALIDAEYVIAEAKYSAASFLNEAEMGKFEKLVEAIAPDKAVLLFTQYCENETEIDRFSTGLKEFLHHLDGKYPYTRFEYFVATDNDDFTNVSDEIGPWGPRTHSFLDHLDKHSTSK